MDRVLLEELARKYELVDGSFSNSPPPAKSPMPGQFAGAVATGLSGRPSLKKKSRSNVDLILLKNSKYAFDLDVVTEQQRNGRLKLFLGIGRVRRTGSIGADLVN